MDLKITKVYVGAEQYQVVIEATGFNGEAEFRIPVSKAARGRGRHKTLEELLSEETFERIAELCRDILKVPEIAKAREVHHYPPK